MHALIVKLEDNLYQNRPTKEHYILSLWTQKQCYWLYREKIFLNIQALRSTWLYGHFTT